ncbi:hypothetical protein PENSPDRAFT_192147 [Peniophora sp. CONT]|nr:hypothetical protein PENSPDRAFT_192147 [Peniophora sp. CONT]
MMSGAEKKKRRKFEAKLAAAIASATPRPPPESQSIVPELSPEQLPRSYAKFFDMLPPKALLEIRKLGNLEGQRDMLPDVTRWLSEDNAASYDKGFQDGMKEGRQAGIKAGIEEGRVQGVGAALKHMGKEVRPWVEEELRREHLDRMCTVYTQTDNDIIT